MVLLRLTALPFVIGLAILAGALLRCAPTPLARSLRGGLARRLCRGACRVLGIRVTLEGKTPADRPALLVANHVSWTDVVAFGSIAPICFLARHDVADWPGLGLLARLFGTLFIERGRLRQIPRVNAQMAQRMRAGDLVALFPEATTGDGTRLKHFHAVHFAAARDLLRDHPDQDSVLVAPAAIVYSHRQGLPLGRNGRAGVAWYGDSEFVPHLLDLVREGGAECRISFLEPLIYRRDSDRKAVARQASAALRTEVARLLSGIAPIEAEPYVLSEPQSV
jgi:1-acyl-sn-glycerol-3-phosphate acyltransferase